MRKRTLVSVLLLCLMVMTGCTEQKSASHEVPLTPLPVTLMPQKPTQEVTVTPFEPISDTLVFSPTEENVKPIGRTVMIDGVRWCAFSGSGIEFAFAGKSCSVRLVGDEIDAGTERNARIGIFIDGTRTKEIMMNEDGMKEVTVEILNSDTDTVANVRIVKLSEAADSTVGIAEIDAVGVVFPITPRKRKIEFIGDSITCGYGVDGHFNIDVYSTANEDCTKAYAYRTAEILGADYSLVCMSGYGIISGYTDSGEKLADKIIPPLYGTLGRSYAHFDGLYSPESFAWDFSEFRPDTVVINLGTNDMSYCKDDPDKRAEFTEQYAAFLRAVRAKNPDAIIVCTLGIMGTDLNQSMQQAVINYKNESGDEKVYVMFFPMQDEADGLAVDWHPSPMTHEKAAGKLAAFLKSLWEE